jgi:hypothetical protein
MKKQKFPRFSFVHVSKNMPQCMSHFDNDFDAIVEGTYKQLHGGYDVNSYAVYQIKKGVIVDNIAWYRENQLTLLPKQAKVKALSMVDKYLAKT